MSESPATPRQLWTIALAATVVRLLLGVLVHPTYGFHRDELLYFAMAEHLELWRMQFPPFIAIVGRASLALFGDDSTLAARVPAALGGAGLTLVVLLIARRLGAGVRALALTAVGMFAAPLFVRAGTLYQPVIFDQLWYALAALGLLRATADDDPRSGWMLVGIGLGLGGLTKFSVAFYAASITLAVLLTPTLRVQLRTRWPWMAAALALSIALPSFTGQHAHDWPIVAQARALQEQQLDRVSPAEYFLEQPLMLGGTFLVVLCGIVGLVRLPSLRAARPLGVAALAIVLLFLAMNGKGYYAGPGYAPLVAVGAVSAVAFASAARGVVRRWLVPGAIALLAITGILLTPAGVPLLAPEPMSRYALALGITRTNYGTALALPQDYADMTGWPEQVAAVAAVWSALPAAERVETQIMGANYGRAGALARHRGAFGLPYPISLSGDFWAWGSGATPARNLLVLGGDPRDLAPFCQSAEVRSRVRNPIAVEEERDVPITFCRGLREPLADIWRRVGPQWG